MEEGVEVGEDYGADLTVAGEMGGGVEDVGGEGG